MQRVTDEITRLGEVPPAQLTQVLTEFYGLLETQQYMVRGGPDYALKLLTEAFGAPKAEELLAAGEEDASATTGDLAMLQKMDPQQLEQVSGERTPADGGAGAGASGCEAWIDRC